MSNVALMESNLAALGLLGNGPSKKKSSSSSKNHGKDRGKRSGSVRPTISGPIIPRADSRQSNTSPVGARTPDNVGRQLRGPGRLLDLDRPGPNGIDRPFAGSACAVCDEPLAHTLRGERVQSLPCTHVAHEACFHEYVREVRTNDCPACMALLGLELSHSGVMLSDAELAELAKAGAAADSQPQHQYGYDPGLLNSGLGRSNSVRSQSSARLSPNGHPTNKHGGHDLDGDRSLSRQHTRTDSGAAGAGSPDIPEGAVGKHHDAHYGEPATNGRRNVRNPIPAPLVTIRSEYPTLTRSRQQQSLTCLVTIEVPERKWKYEPEDDVARSGAHALTPPAVTPSPVTAGQAPPPAANPPSKGHTARSRSLVSNGAERERMVADLRDRVENWHSLDVMRFGKLYFHTHIRVGKDRRTWQDLECYLFAEMLICVKEKRQPAATGDAPPPKPRCNLKGSILIKKHLRQVEENLDELVLTLCLSVAELPEFHLQFADAETLDLWRQGLMQISVDQEPIVTTPEPEQEASTTDGSENTKAERRLSSVTSIYNDKTPVTVPTEASSLRNGSLTPAPSPEPHVPIDIVVVVPVTSSMQGLKITLMKDALRFLIANLGDRDRLGLVTFGSTIGGLPVVGMTSKNWHGWRNVLDSIKPHGQKNLRADVVDGANVALDLLMQRKSVNPLSSILLISDSSTPDPESVDFAVSRAEAAKVTIHSIGLGLTHKPDAMIELSTRTKASYTYVKDWNALRECVAGCLGSLQSTSHQNAKLKLHLPEGSPARFVKISGAMHINKKASGKDADAGLGNLRFGDKRDILVQLVIEPYINEEQVPHDPWESIVSGLEALGSTEAEETRPTSIEEVPLLQADLSFGDVLRDGQVSHLPRPTLLTITVLPSATPSRSGQRSSSPPIPPHPSIVVRRMELLTSDMFTRALTLVSRGQHERAHQLLTETRSILKGFNKGSLPPLPPSAGRAQTSPAPGASAPKDAQSPTPDSSAHTTDASHSTSPRESTRSKSSFSQVIGIDPATMDALDAELESSLEWINHPAVFSRDSRKAVLQAIGVISSQRGYTFRTPIESLWAERIPGVKRVSDREKEWREQGTSDTLAEE